MIDCSKEIKRFHDEKVRLAESQKQKMRQHRVANQNRLKSGLEKNEKPLPKEFIKQGSYAMYTMIQHPENDYDIDDGAVFLRDDLKGPQGGDMTPREARDMICEALDDGSFKTPPEVLKNCVRVYYEAGYHVDIPVYRRYENDLGETILELASSEWRKSDPTDLTNWFNSAVIDKSPDENNGQQMRRIVCLLKKFSRSRTSWNLPSGLILSVLTNEKYYGIRDHDDETLYNLLQDIYNRIIRYTQVFNPKDVTEELTKGVADTKIEELRDRLKWALDQLKDVKSESCDKNEALKRWNKVFNTDFFSQFMEDDDSASEANKLDILVAASAATAPKSWGGSY